ncbi:potassium channel family protein [Vulcanococcus limneticus]|uniref:potassium channel family protein n=1 Tax=Vulcanococcus limneticus TaxID=2170428 RepID=UPI00398BC2F1
MLCLVLVGAYALPPVWNRMVAVSCFALLPLVLLRGIGQASPDLPFRRWVRLGYWLLGLLSLVAFLFWHFTPVGLKSSGLPVLVLWTLFVGWSSVRLVKALAREPVVHGPVLQGAMAGYLLLGLTAGLLFSALETLHPGSFTSVHHAGGQLLVPRTSAFSPGVPVQQLDMIRFHYFALVTLTTTGYGDILPVTPQAQMASVVLALVGTTYVAVVMALLISRLTVQESVGGPGGSAGDGRRDGEGPRD